MLLRYAVNQCNQCQCIDSQATPTHLIYDGASSIVECSPCSGGLVYEGLVGGCDAHPREPSYRGHGGGERGQDTGLEET